MLLRRLFYTCAFLSAMPTYAANFHDLTQHVSDHVQIIDARSSDYFNGWPQGNETRGGHYPNAVNINANWLPLLHHDQFQTLLTQDHLTPTTLTYVYGSKDNTEALTQALARQGFTHIQSINEPLSNYHGPLVALPNFQHLVSAQWLHQLIDGQHVNFAPKHGYKVIEVNWGPPTKYLFGHIPNSLYLNTDDIESKPWWNHVSAADLTKTFQSLGITENTTVILYGYNTMAADRAAQIMMYAGVKDVRLLNGGYPAWQSAQYPTQAFYNKATPSQFGTSIPANPRYIIGIPKVKQMLTNTVQNSVVSVRTWAEYTGKISGYSYIKPKGRILDAKWGQSGTNAYNMDSYYNPNHTVRNPYAIAALWKDWGITPQQNVTFYCGTGWRASVAFFDAYLMGWQDISVFDGGWYQWSGEKHDPTATGSVAIPA